MIIIAANKAGIEGMRLLRAMFQNRFCKAARNQYMKNKWLGKGKIFMIRPGSRILHAMVTISAKQLVFSLLKKSY